MSQKKNKEHKSSSLLQLDPSDYSALKYTMRNFGFMPNKYLSMDCWVTWMKELNELRLGRIDILSEADRKFREHIQAQRENSALNILGSLHGFIGSRAYHAGPRFPRMTRKEKRKKTRPYDR